MLLEVKSSGKIGPYQKATKQLFDGIERLQDVFASIGLNTTTWKYVGVFFALHGSDKPLFDCENCSLFTIIGAESIQTNFKLIEEEIAQKHANSWKPEEHVEEFVNLAKQVLFIAQGDPYAPVTGSNLIDKTVKYVEEAGSATNTILLTPDQLSIVQAMEEVPFMFLDAFYSCGKSTILRYYGKHKLKKNEKFHYFNQRPPGLKGNTTLLPFTQMLMAEFPPDVVKETTFQFGIDSVKRFLKENGIDSTHHVIFDEAICIKYTKGFRDSLIAMKNSVASFWIAMGAQPITGENNAYYFSFHCTGTPEEVPWSCLDE